MKTDRKGRVKLAKNEVRVANFVYAIEKDHIKVQDINGICSHRVSRYIIKGQILEMALEGLRNGEKDKESFLHAYGAVIMNVLCAVPLKSESGFDFLAEVDAIANKTVTEFPSLYGGIVTSDEENEEILRDVEETEKEIDEFNKRNGNE